MSQDEDRPQDQKEREDPIPEELEKDIADPNIPINPADPLDYVNVAFNQVPAPSNADNTAVDPMGNIHSGSALPDPIGDQLEGETDAESLDYYQEDILDEDPTMGSPDGVANEPSSMEEIRHAQDEIADEDENVLDRIEEAKRLLEERKQ